MADQTPPQGEWGDRVDRLLAGSTVEQVRELVGEVRSGLDRIASGFDRHAESVEGATSGMDSAVGAMRADVEGMRAQVAALAERMDAVQNLRDDLVRALEAVAAHGGSSSAPDAVAEQGERLLGAFAQRIGALQTAIVRDSEAMTERIAGLEQRLGDPGRIEPALRDVAALAREGVDRIRSLQAGLEGADAPAAIAAAVRADLSPILTALGQSQTGLAERLEPAFREVADSTREAAEATREAMGRLSAIQVQIDALPSPGDVAAAVRGDVVEALREDRDAQDARAGSLVEEIGGMRARLDAVASALAPLEGLRTEIASVVDRTPSGDAIAAGVRAELEGLAATIDERIAAVRTIVSEELAAAQATIAAEVGTAVAAETEQIKKGTDGLGLRLTNISMAVSQALDSVRDRTEMMAQRAQAIESENAAILQAVRDEVASIAQNVAQEVAARTSTIAGDVAQRTGAIGDTVAARNAELLEEITSRIASLSAGIEARTTGIADEVGARALDAGRGTAEAVQQAIAPMLEALGTRIPTADDLAAPLRAELAEGLDAVRSQTDDALARLRAELAAVTQPVAAQIAEFATRIPSVEALTGPLRGQIEAFAESVPTAETLSAPLRAQLESVAASLGEQLSTATTQMMGRLEGAATAASAEASRVTEEARAVSAEIAATARAQSEGIAADVRAQNEALVARMTEALTGSAQTVAAGVETLTGEIRAQLADVSARFDVLRDVREEVASLAREVRNDLTTIAEVRTGVEDAVTSIGMRMGETTQRLSMRLDAVESAVAKLLVDIGGVVAQGATSTREAMREQVAALGDRAAEIAGELSAAKDVVGSVSARTERAIGGVVERLQAVEQALQTRASDAATAAIATDLNAVASNINEIWMRVRGLATATEGVGASVVAQAEENAARAAQTRRELEDMLRGVQVKVSARFADLDARLASSLETVRARDGVFAETLTEIAQRLPRADRRRLTERLLPWRRSEDTPAGADRDQAPAQDTTPPPAPATTERVPTKRTAAKRTAKATGSTASTANRSAATKSTKTKKSTAKRSAAKSTATKSTAPKKTTSKAARSPSTARAGAKKTPAAASSQKKKTGTKRRASTPADRASASRATAGANGDGSSSATGGLDGGERSAKPDASAPVASSPPAQTEPER